MEAATYQQAPANARATIPKSVTLRQIKCIYLHPQGRILPFLKEL